MNPLIHALYTTPRTNAEARAFEKLVNIADTAKLYSALFHYYDKGIEYDWLCRGEQIPEKTQKTLSEIRDMIRKAKAHIGAELINLIDEYNERLADVKKDKRPRHQILESEGYNSQTGKFE